MLDRPDRQRRLLDLIFWLPTFAGVAVLVAGLAFIGVRVFGTSDEPVGLLPPPVQQSPPGLADPSGAGATDGAAPVESSGPAVPTAGPTDSPADRPTTKTRPPATRPPAGPVTGTYRVLNSYGDAFIAEVLVANSAGRASDWTVTVRFPSTVGRLITSWVESAPQATLTISGQTYTWRSGVPVPAGSSVPLRFHFARSGTGDFPAACTVNGSPCTIRR